MYLWRIRDFSQISHCLFTIETNEAFFFSFIGKVLVKWYCFCSVDVTLKLVMFPITYLQCK